MRKRFDQFELLHSGGSSRGSLWLGPDHLLVIETSGFLLAFHEKYRRFDYDRIEGVFWSETRRPRLAAGVWTGVLAFSAAMTATGLAADRLWQVVLFGIWAVLGAIFTAFEWSSGPRGRCHIRTAVGTFPLRAVSRARVARKAADLLVARCREAQDLLVGFRAKGTAEPSASAVPLTANPPKKAARAPADPKPPAVAAYLGYGAAVVVGILLLAQVFGGGAPWVVVMTALVTLAAMLGLLLAVLRSRGFADTGSAAAWWLAFISQMLVLGAGYMVSVAVEFRSVFDEELQNAGPIAGPLREMSAVMEWGGGIAFWGFFLIGLFSLVSGAWGLVAAVAYGAQVRRALAERGAIVDTPADAPAEKAHKAVSEAGGQTAEPSNAPPPGDEPGATHTQPPVAPSPAAPSPPGTREGGGS